MRQVICVRSLSVPANSGTSYVELTSTPTSGGGGEYDVKCLWPTAGTFRNFVVALNAAPGSGKSWAFTLRKNGTDTSVTCTVSDAATTARDTTNSFTVAAGDQLTVKVIPTGSPTALAADGIQFSVEFEGTTANESGYAWGPDNAGTATCRHSLFTGSLPGWTTSAGSTVENVVAAAGTITALYVSLHTDSVDAAGVISFHVYKNGVKQDGGGGTANTLVSFTDADLTPWIKSATFSLAVAAGDTFYVERSDSGGNTFAAAVGIGVRFVATTDGQSQFCGYGSGDIHTASASFQKAHSDGGTTGWNTTESAGTILAGVTSFSLSKLHVKLQGSPGSGKSYTIDARKNAASPAGTTSVTIADAATTGADATSNAASYVDGDTFTIRAVPSGTPTARAAAWAFIQTVAAPAIIGSAVFGAYGTLTSSLTFLANLDGVTRTVHAPATMYVGGNIALPEQAVAPTALPNMARIYTVDDGSGKTKLMVIFGSGAAVQIAVEP